MRTLEDCAGRIADLADLLYGFALKDWEDYQSMKADVSTTLDSIQTAMAPAVEKLKNGISQYFRCQDAVQRRGPVRLEEGHDVR